MIPTNPCFDILHIVTIFAGFTDLELGRLCGKCSVVSFPANEEFIEEGCEAQDIYIILRGSVKIVLNLHTKPMEIVQLPAGHCVGEASVIGIQKHSASAVTVEPCDFLVLTRQTLMEMYDNDKGLFSLLILNIARELARRLYKTDQLLGSL